MAAGPQVVDMRGRVEGHLEVERAFQLAVAALLLEVLAHLPDDVALERDEPRGAEPVAVDAHAGGGRQAHRPRHARGVAGDELVPRRRRFGAQPLDRRRRDVGRVRGAGGRRRADQRVAGRGARLRRHLGIERAALAQPAVVVKQPGRAVAQDRPRRRRRSGRPPRRHLPDLAFRHRPRARQHQHPRVAQPAPLDLLLGNEPRRQPAVLQQLQPRAPHLRVAVVRRLVARKAPQPGRAVDRRLQQPGDLDARL